MVFGGNLTDDENCLIGSTDAAGIEEQRFPIAVGGLVHAVADGYVGSSRPLDTAGNASTLEIELYAYHTVNLTIEKKNMLKVRAESTDNPFAHEKVIDASNWHFVDAALPLRSVERGIIHLNRISEWDDNFEFATVIEGPIPSEILLPAGEYEVQMRLVLNEPITIPKQVRCVKEGAIFGMGVEQSCFKIPELNFDQINNGGLILNKTYPLNVTSDPYYTSTNLIIYTLAIGLQETPRKYRVMEDIDEINKIERYSTANYAFMQPTYGASS
jgi:hypothetical protein